MATRSTIARKTDTGIESIYCHWDGYPAYNGRILQEHYTNDEKIAELLSLGDLSSLDKDIGEQHSFDDRPEGACTFYGRDRGETGIDALQHESVDAWLGARDISGCEYGYLWDGKQWTTYTI